MAVLVVVNILMAASIWLKKDGAVPPQPPGDARDYLLKTLTLTDGQTKAFDSLRRGHFERMKAYKTQMRNAKDGLFAGLKEPHAAQTDSLAQKIGSLQATIDLETFNHFSQLRQLLTADQAKKFDGVIQNVLRTLDPRAPRPEGFAPRGGGPGGRTGPPGEGPDGMRPPPPGSEPPTQ